jgi:hypothetical protein
MPDQISLLQALSAAAVTAAAVLLLCGLGRKNRPALATVGTVLGVGLGFCAGCAWLGIRPHWPPREDQDRWLLILFPSVIIVEILATALKKWAWLLRVALAASAAWILLYGSVYLEDLAGPGSREWTPEQTWSILSLLAAALLAVWASLAELARRSGGRTVPLALALTCGVAAVTVMLSGYASGGQLGLPLAAAVVGALLASLLLPGSIDAAAATGLALVGLFALLVIGRFFGELTTNHAIALFLAPLLCWLPELPPVRRLDLRWRGVVRVLLAAVPLAVVLSLAQQKFTAAVTGPSSGSQEGSIDDYRNYGK